MDDEEDHDEQRDDRLFDVETLRDVADDRHEQQRVREQPRVALTAPHAPRQQQQPDSADRDQRGRDLGNLDRREVGRAREARRERQRHGRREVQHARERDRERPIRRVRRRSAVASPADGQVTVPGCFSPPTTR